MPKNWKIKCRSVKARGFRGVDREFRKNFKQARLGTKRELWRRIMSKRDKEKHRQKLIAEGKIKPDDAEQTKTGAKK